VGLKLPIARTLALAPGAKRGEVVGPRRVGVTVQTQNDGARVDGSLAYYVALRAERVPVEMQLDPTGGHGYGLRPSPDTMSTWPARAAGWMRSLGALPSEVRDLRK
jgi:hypothetical protein